MAVHMDYTLSMKQMLSSRIHIELSDHAHVMTNTSSLMKKRMAARSSGVMKAVVSVTAMRKHRNALNGVHTDSDSTTKEKSRSMASIDQLEPVAAMTNLSILMKKDLPVSTSSVLKLVQKAAMREQIDAGNHVITD